MTFEPCRFGDRVSQCYHVPRCTTERSVAHPAGPGRFGREQDCCGKCQQVADELADAIVAAAVAAHPGDPEAVAADAMATVNLILGPAPIVSTESPSMTPAELERRLASPGAKWSR